MSSLGDLHDPFDAGRFDEDGDRVELGHFEPLDGVPAHVQYTVFAFFGNFAHRLNARSVQVAMELACFDEEMILDVSFHLLARVDEIVVAAFDLVVLLGTRGVCKRDKGEFFWTQKRRTEP